MDLNKRKEYIQYLKSLKNNEECESNITVENIKDYIEYIENDEDDHVVTCNDCEWIGTEEDLEMCLEVFDNDDKNKASYYKYGYDVHPDDLEAMGIEYDIIKGCPHCLSDAMLGDRDLEDLYEILEKLEQ